MAEHNHTAPDMGRPQSEARAWFEPLLVVSIMLSSLYFNRDRAFSVIGAAPPDYDDASELLMKQVEHDEGRSSSRAGRPSKTRDSSDLARPKSPSSWSDSSPASMNFPSRILQKFPFFVEMFYWALNFVAYSMTKKVGASLYSRYENNEMTELAQQHGIDILTLEHNTPFSIFFPFTEVGVQQYFLNNHISIMTIFNQIYSLVHIPGTVAFLSWFYYSAPSHEVFAIARRTMTLGNFAAFTVFSFYPCMPPRLLPESFGFRDTVRQEHAESVWVGGKNINQLAAMPSLHFTYAFVIGCTFFYQSGLLHICRGGRARRSPVMSCVYIVAGILYPLLVLTVIVATANHYYLDAVVATFTVTLSFFSNRLWMVLLPLEGLLCRTLRLRKPTPTTAKFRTSLPDRAQRWRSDVA